MRLIAGAAVAAGALALSGCYYLQLAAGQLEMNRRREPIADLVARSDTDLGLRQRLGYASRARDFAITDLGLPDNGSYRSYADLGRPYATWNLFAAPEFSVKPRHWCFPIAGCVSYRGYFKEVRASRAARSLASRGNDVYAGPSLAYSTLGHLRDPLLNTMLGYGDAELAALIFHELTHQQVYVRGDSDFNEAFATVVENEGTRRWLTRLGRDDDLNAFLTTSRREQQLIELMVATRDQLATLYQSGMSVEAMRAGKATEFSRLRDSMATLGVKTAGDLNNARLAAVATYHRCVPALTALLAEHHGNLPEYYAAIRALAHDEAGRSALCPREKR
ncbi:MAG: aminopeptidase [Steroidobacteraceae bacterium]